ncbi:lactonase family protein [Caballeronia udeis]
MVVPSAFAATDRASRPTNSKGQGMFAYVGCRTTRERNARGDGISVYSVDQEAGRLELVQLLKDLVNPSFLALSANGERLYTVHGDLSDISSFAVDKASGKITFLNKQSTQGQNPVHLAIDPTGRYVVVSNHIGSSLAVLPIAEDGSLNALTQLVKLEGPLGPHRVEQTVPKPHFNPFDPSGEFVIVPAKGLDRVLTYRFKDGQLSPGTPAFVTARETSGPRHIAFHPRSGFAYCINELDSTVTTYRYSSANGSLQPLQTVSTLPDTFTGNSRASEIEVDRSGRYVYASNRGYDSVAVFRIAPDTGFLSLVEAGQSRGRTPRFMTSTPDGRFMFVLNEDSDSIVAFAVDQTSGRIKPTGFSVQTGSPVCMVFSQHQA